VILLTTVCVVLGWILVKLGLRGARAGIEKIGRKRIFIGAFVAVLIVGGVQLCRRELELRPFRKHLQEYLSPRNLKKLTPQAPYIRGKVIIVDKSKGKFDDLFFELPDSLKATDPAEVGTVIWTAHDRECIGTYHPVGLHGSEHRAGTGYRRTCTIKIIDRSLGVVVGNKTFYGKDPPPYTSGGGDRYGDPPSSRKIVRYIAKLPRRPLPDGRGSRTEDRHSESAGRGKTRK